MLAGSGLARRFASDEADGALCATGLLAVFVLLLGDSAAIWGFHLWVATSIAALLAIAGWALPSRPSSSCLRTKPQSSRSLIPILAATSMLLVAPMLLLPVPPDTDAQGFGYLSLMIRQGGTLTTLAPWHPEISYVYTPGALLVFATLSGLVPALPMSAVMMGSAHAAALVFVWLAWHFGCELARWPAESEAPASAAEEAGMLHRWGLCAGLCAALSAGMWSALLDAHYTAIFGLLFTLACFSSALRYLRVGGVLQAGLTALFLAAAGITHVDSAIALAMGLAAMLVLAPAASHRPPLRRRLTVAVGVPTVSVGLLAPWLLRIRPLLATGIQSPFKAHLSHWKGLVAYHAVIWPLLALGGVWLLLRRRPLWALGMMGWLAALAAVSLFDVAGVLSQGPLSVLSRFVYPFSLAWHGPIIPYLALATAALARLSRSLEIGALSRLTVRGSIGVVALTTAALAAQRPLLVWSKQFLHVYGSFSSANDVKAMHWIRDHTTQQTRILNYPGDLPGSRDWEAHWAPVIAERDSVYFRWQPFFIVDSSEPGDPGPIAQEQRELLSFWRNPSDPSNVALLRQASIRYVLVPEVVNDPTSWSRAWRWRPPALLPETIAPLQQAPYLELVYQAGGAQVLQFSP